MPSGRGGLSGDGYERRCGGRAGGKAGLPPLAGRQPRYPAQGHGQRRPASDGPGAGPRVGVIGDAGEQPAQFDSGRQLAALIEGGADHPGRSFLGPQWPDNLGSVSWRWLCRLKWASSEKAGIFAFAFQSVAVPQTGASRKWGDHAAVANGGPEVETGSNRWPNPEPSAPL